MKTSKMSICIGAACIGMALLLGALGLEHDGWRIHAAIRAYQGHNDWYLKPTKCGALVRLAPNLARLPDGSAIYFDNASGRVVANCDNPLIMPVPAKPVRCPPAGWTCGP